MKKIPVVFFITIITATLAVKAQDTFSIEAVDSATGAIGDAGASCVGVQMPTIPHGALIISDLVPGVGSIHTQAYWDSTNQNYAHSLLLAGLHPQQILDSLYKNDVQAQPQIRQYGIVIYNNGHPETGAFTGTGCDAYKNHIIGRYYTIQGNTLLGQKVLDSMEALFLRTKGPLADRLMATLQGAKMVGADTRCGVHNTSSLSSFLRVAMPTDKPGNFYVDINMAYDQAVTGKLKTDPIDSLQSLFNIKMAGVDNAIPVNPKVRLFYNNNTAFLDFSSFAQMHGIEVALSDIRGRMIYRKNVTNSLFPLFEHGHYPNGVYIYQIFKNGGELENGKVVR